MNNSGKFEKWHEKAQCRFIGWNYSILSSCGEHSHRLLKIYCNAISIIMVIWFTIGFVFSQRYIGISSTLGCVTAASVFAFIVYYIERIIILHSDSKGILIFRTALSICMAVLGAFIFDQLIFRNDIQNEIRSSIYENTKIEVNSIINDLSLKRNQLSSSRDSLFAIYIQNPTTPVPKPVPRPETDSTGNTRIEYTYVMERQPNPVISQIDIANKEIKALDSSIANFRSTNIDSICNETLRARKTGFLDELKISASIITDSIVSIVFYIILCVVLLFLELFVVALKLFKSPKSEYELITEHQRIVKSEQLESMRRSCREKFITHSLDSESSQ